MKINELDFSEYLGFKEKNLLTSIIVFRSEFDLFYELDGIYQEPLRRLRPSEENLLIPSLYFFVHFHLYFSISCLLRCHLSECLSSMRKATDATLSAYKIILEPQTSEKYITRDRYFQHIKNNIQKEIQKDASKYPLAHRLIYIHDECSQYGSHADMSSFIKRLQVKDYPETKDYLLSFGFFQYPEQREEFKFYFIVTLQAFFLMFMIFKLFFDANLRIIDPNWEKAIKTLGPELEELQKRYYSQIK